MDFFAQQDSARRRTTYLVGYFVAAVVMIVVLLNLGVAYGFGYFNGVHVSRHGGSVSYSVETPANAPTFLWRRDAVLWTTGLTLAVILGGAFYRWLTLRDGGRAVARIAGGRELVAGTTDPAERRLLNIVEEMSIASGVPMPAVFVLDGEPGLNAFAAGYTPSDAAIAVTSGCLERLSRDELQGVVAHEFSHLLNGDMRLNVRLMAVLFGIFMIAMIGRGILRSLLSGRRSSRNDKGGGAIVAFAIVGLAILIIGYIGYFFGRLIQSAVSRQREFLADAAAVQFTRNPAGIGGALKKIGALALGSSVISERATQIRHFFFSQAFTGGLSLFATHPPLELRIRAVDSQWDGKFPEIGAAAIGGWEGDSAVPRREFVPPPLPPRAVPAAVLLASVGTASPEHLDRARQLLAAIPPRLADAARSPAEVLFVVFALLLAKDESTRHRQLDTVRIRHGQPFADGFVAFVPAAAVLDPALRLPLVNLTLPALRALPAAEVAGALETSRLLIAADGEVTLFEFMLEKALARHVGAPAGGARRGQVSFYSFGSLAGEFSLLLSALARVGSDSAEETAQAFAAAAARIPALQGRLTLEPPAACSLAAISDALDKLVQASTAIRKVLLMAGTEAISADGSIEPDEAELLRAVADALDCPIPPLVGAA